MRLILALMLSLTTFSAAHAQEVIGEYFTLLSPQDMRNSGGARLSSLGQVVQQDRANFHRFGRRDDLDQSDPFFGDPALRSRIPDMVRVRHGFEYIRSDVLAGQSRYVWVRILGSKGMPQILEIIEGAG